MTDSTYTSSGRYVVRFATGQEVTRTAPSWAALIEEYEARGFRPGDYLITPVVEPLTDEQVKDFDFDQAATAERSSDRAQSDTYPDVFAAAEAAQVMADELGEACYVRKERGSGHLVVQPATPVDGNRFLTIWGPAEPTDHGYLTHARYLGADAALAAASWLTMDESDARSILDDVDPEVMDRYPGPNLSGEWADDLTPQTLAEIVNPDCPEGCDGSPGTHGDTDVIAAAWEEGRDMVWSDALQATALRVLGDIPNALRVEQANETIAASYRKAAGL